MWQETLMEDFDESVSPGWSVVDFRDTGPVAARLFVLDLFINQVLSTLNESPVSEEDRLRLRARAQGLRGLARELRNDLGIT